MRTIFISATVIGIWLKSIYYQLTSDPPIHYSPPRRQGNEETAEHGDESALVNYPSSIPTEQVGREVS